jgi:hypothetical protein
MPRDSPKGKSNGGEGEPERLRVLIPVKSNTIMIKEYNRNLRSLRRPVCPTIRLPV